jgi:hypothetical protein
MSNGKGLRGEAGAWPRGSRAWSASVRGIEYVPITFEIPDDLAYWGAEVPERRQRGPRR